MAVKEIYVDPSLDASPQIGDGSIGSPYSDLEYAILNDTMGADGTRINIKVGTPEVLAAPLQTAISTAGWTISASEKLIFQGYTAAAGDGGIAQVDCNAQANFLLDANLDGVVISHLEIYNCTGTCIDIDNQCVIQHCEIHNVGGTGMVGDDNCVFCFNYLHDIDGSAISSLDSLAYQNVIIDEGPNYGGSMVAGINATTPMHCIGNIIKITGNGSGIRMGSGAFIVNNTIIGTASGTGEGIYAAGDSVAAGCINNLIEGFANAIGFDAQSKWYLANFGGNSVYNSPGGIKNDMTVGADLGGNETLTESPVEDAANNDFTPRDTGSIREGSVPAEFQTID